MLHTIINFAAHNNKNTCKSCSWNKASHMCVLFFCFPSEEYSGPISANPGLQSRSLGDKQEVNFVRFWTKLNKSRFYQILSIQFTRLISLIQLPCNDRKNKYFRNKLSYFQVLTSITLRKRDRLEEDENNCNNQSNFPFDIRVFTRSTLKS